MGILNVTPDSFSDGGLFLDPSDALRRAETMIEEGAQIIDVGGESSRPSGSVYGEGASSVAAREEVERVEPVVRAIADRFPEVLISVDTYKPDVARAALAAGAHLINDVTGLRYHPEVATLAAEAGAGMILMHSLGRPGEMPHEHHYDDVVRDVREDLARAVQIAREAGVRAIATDPGFGFGKTPEENMRLLGAVDLFRELGHPVLVGISRKSTIGSVLGDEEPLPVGERLYGTLGATAGSVARGASIVRTHDVRATVQMLRCLHLTLHSHPGPPARP